MTVRRAVAMDAPRIHELLRATFEPLAEHYTPAALLATIPGEAELIRRLREGPTWIAVSRDGTRRDAVVGTIGARDIGRGLWLRSLAVAPTARNRGLGHALIDAAEEYARIRNMDRLWLSTTPFLEAAIALYERRGFHPTSLGPADLGGTPLITMEKRMCPAPSSR